MAASVALSPTKWYDSLMEMMRCAVMKRPVEALPSVDDVDFASVLLRLGLAYSTNGSEYTLSDLSITVSLGPSSSPGVIDVSRLSLEDLYFKLGSAAVTKVFHLAADEAWTPSV